MNKVKIISLTASMVFAAMFAFSCSDENGGSGYSGTYGSVVYRGQTYKTVRIGKQVWFAENLNYDPGTGNSVCYDNRASNCATYGRLYDWATAMGFASSCNSNSCSVQPKHKGICPSGWHIPSDAEWSVLEMAVGDISTAGAKLKATRFGKNDRSGTDEYGFSALPGGFGYSDVSFKGVGGIGHWWSASESESNSDDADSRGMYYYSGYAYGREMISGSDIVYWVYHHKSDLRSVRCVQD